MSRKKPVVWNGIEYPSIKAAAAALRIHPQAMWKRVKNGYTCDADLGKRIWPTWTDNWKHYMGGDE